MNFKFEFLNIHISHLTQLGMINITLKCQEKNICKKVHSFHHYPTWFLVPISLLAPWHNKVELWATSALAHCASLIKSVQYTHLLTINIFYKIFLIVYSYYWISFGSISFSMRVSKVQTHCHVRTQELELSFGLWICWTLYGPIIH
jgi:hypothetical protein